MERKIGLFYNICMKINKITKPKYFRFKGLLVYLSDRKGLLTDRRIYLFCFDGQSKIGYCNSKKSTFRIL